VLYLGFQNGEFSGGFSGFYGRNWDHIMADFDSWNVYLLADLAEVIPIIVQLG